MKARRWAGSSSFSRPAGSGGGSGGALRGAEADGAEVNGAEADGEGSLPRPAQSDGPHDAAASASASAPVHLMKRAARAILLVQRLSRRFLGEKRGLDSRDPRGLITA
jgi:hypothetical protein